MSYNVKELFGVKLKKGRKLCFGYPTVVLITGSHPQDRDMLRSHKEPINNYRPFRQLADALSRKGIAVLRMDDRGYGCSEDGDINDATISLLIFLLFIPFRMCHFLSSNNR